MTDANAPRRALLGRTSEHGTQTIDGTPRATSAAAAAATAAAMTLAAAATAAAAVAARKSPGAGVFRVLLAEDMRSTQLAISRLLKVRPSWNWLTRIESASFSV